MTDDDFVDAVRDIQGRGAEYHELHGARPAPVRMAYCATCGLFHDSDTVCGVAKAAVEASIMYAGEVVTMAEIGDVDRPALDRALALRGLALEQLAGQGNWDGYYWRVVAGPVAA